MQFVYPALAWGFLLTLLPLLIHLINMMRRRRVRWAAMEFLLQSHRRHRKWIWLRQLLLLAARMAVIATVVAMLAGWVTRRQWLSLLGRRATHHVVLLDDSYSMAHQAGGASAFDRATQVVDRLARRALDQDTPQRFTLIRFSRAAAAAASDSGGAADLAARAVDSRFEFQLRELTPRLAPSQLAVGPRAALAVARELMDQGADEDVIVYVLSDFRRKDWERPEDARRLLIEMDQAGAAIQLVGCAPPGTDNLTLTAVRPADETRAAGVPLFVEISVRNQGAEPVRNAPVAVRSIYYPALERPPGSLAQLQGEATELPAVLFDEIPPGVTVTRRAQVYFPAPGAHAVEAALPQDPLPPDNRRWCVIDFPEGERALIVDGDPNRRNAFYLSAVFQPGGRAATGVTPDVQSAAFLREADAAALAQYACVYLLDVPRLDDRAVETLEQYVRAGGGLAVFVGPQVNLAFYNQRLYRGGDGLLPLPLGRQDALQPELGDNVPDVVPENHPVFEPFFGQRNPLIRLVNVDRYIRPEEGWSPPADSTVALVARLRNRRPLAAERRFGDGRVFLVLTTLAPDWNNWAQDPSFVVAALKLQSYLAAGRRRSEDRLVGAPLQWTLDAAKYRREVVFTLPGEQPDVRIDVARQAQRERPGGGNWKVALGPAPGGRPGETDRAGVYEAWLRTVDGRLEARRWAANVDPDEGDLRVTPPAQLLARLEPARVRFAAAEAFEQTAAEQAGLNRSLLLLGVLLGLLAGEQLLAYYASYHPPRRTSP